MWPQFITHRAFTFLVLLLAAAAPLHADPEAEYRDGRRAFFAGDMSGATTLLRKAADRDHAPAQALLARVLRHTDGTAEALQYLRKAAAQGYAEAQFELGAAYAAGEGVKRDPEEARRWMTRAAQGGYRSAIVVMADAYIGGGLGIEDSERSGAAALEWIRRAAEHGHAPALQRLAAAYRAGEMGLVANAAAAAALEAKARAVGGLMPPAGAGRRGAQ